MENASKALIIAGAILISIVIISLGVVIIGQGQDVVDNSNMDDQVVSTWNQKWTQYEGDSISGSNVNTLINQVLSSNVTANNAGEVAKIIRISNANSGTIGNATSNNRISGMTNSYTGCKTGETNNTANWGTSKITTKAKTGAHYKVALDYNGHGYVCGIKISPNE